MLFIMTFKNIVDIIRCIQIISQILVNENNWDIYYNCSTLALISIFHKNKDLVKKMSLLIPLSDSRAIYQIYIQ